MYPTCFDVYSVASKHVGDFFQIFLAFLENLNFNSMYLSFNHNSQGQLFVTQYEPFLLNWNKIYESYHFEVCRKSVETMLLQ